MGIKPVSIYDRIVNFINKKPIQKIIRYADKNPAIFQSATVFTMCSVLRPITILATPAKTDDMKKDRVYSSAKSISSGITDLAFSFAVFKPLNKFIDQRTEKIAQNKDCLIYNNPKAIKMYKNLFNRGAKLLTIPIIAFLNYRYVKDIADLIIKREKHENK